MREKILAHPIRWLIGLCACLVFFGCFGFPIHNFTTGRRFGSWYLLLALCFFYLSLMTLLGLACRFLMEFGEVSNTEDFTLPNVALHLFVVVALTTLGSLSPVVDNQRPPLRNG